MTNERGSAAVGTMIVLTPILLVALWFAVLVGRFVTVQQDVHSAAFDGARAASLVTAGAADGAARAAVEGTLAGNGIACKNLVVDTTVGSFGAGRAVTVSVACEVDVSDVTSVWAPGSRVIEHSATAAIDIYRGGEE